MHCRTGSQRSVSRMNSLICPNLGNPPIILAAALRTDYIRSNKLDISFEEHYMYVCEHCNVTNCLLLAHTVYFKDYNLGTFPIYNVPNAYNQTNIKLKFKNNFISGVPDRNQLNNLQIIWTRCLQNCGKAKLRRSE